MGRHFLTGLLVIAVLVTGFGCSSGDKPTATPAVIVVTATPAPAEPKPATPAPANTPAGAATITQASAASAPATSASTPTPNQVGTQRIEAHALWVSRKTGKYDGGTSRIRVSVEKTGSSKELRVGFFEEEVGGSGPMWRASGWMAVIMSSLLLGVDPAQYKYSYDVGGSIDGPSAGALMTVSTVAALLGDTVKADAAMTGTINPDGTIGPVGGIPHKIDGAAAAGKKLVLVPAGSRRSTDSNTNTSVDVIERGRSKNVEVKEVADIYEAYELLTGKPLPKAPGMKEVRPELPSTSFERVRAKSKEWYTRFWQLESQYNALPRAIREESFNSMMSEAADHGKKSDDYYKQGMASASYSQALSATLKASVAFHAAKVVEAYLNGRMQSANAYLDSLSSVRLKSEAFIDRLQTQQPKTLGDLIAVSDAYGFANLAMGLIELGNAATKRQVTTEEEAITALAEASLYYAIAEHAIEMAKDAIDVGVGYGKAPIPPQEQVDALAELLRRAAEANLNYFNSVVVDGIAQEAGVHPDIVKAKFGGQEMSYTFANSSLGNLEWLKKRAGTGPSGSYATLGGAMSSYIFSSGLVAKYYSLGAKVDKDGELTGVTNERAMINMLDFAEKRAKEAIGLAVSLDVEPVQPVLYFEDAKVSREGNTGDKLDALENYWRTSLEGQIIGMLSGKTRLVKP